MHLFYNIISRPQQCDNSAHSTAGLPITLRSKVAASRSFRVRLM
jgi:hypothetical protein